MTDIILNCLPPFRIDMPSASLSILKGYLLENKVDSDIIYWNIKYMALLYKYFNVSKLKEDPIISSFLSNEFSNVNIELVQHKRILYEYRKNQYQTSLSRFYKNGHFASNSISTE